ncbi:MAG TPA: hypothetical protein VFN02_11995 [Ktedonobacteraceae bacterium]|nr:hypothetical protein [Ktedonobacteraceae bacterium]
MQTMPFRRFQGMFVCTVVLAMLILMTACSSTGISTPQPATGSTLTTTSATTTSATQVPPTATQPPASTPSTVAFMPGGISFIGPVKSITSSSLVMSAPNGQSYTMAINAQTDRSAYGGGLPAVRASVDMDSAVNPNGSLTATILKPAVPGDPDLNVIAYTGITTSAVGADRVIHFTVGVKSYTFTIPATADLSAYNGNAQAIGINATVKVKVSYPANTVVSITNPNS